MYVGTADAARRTLYNPKSKSREIWEMIMVKLITKNRSIMNKLLSESGKVSMDKVATIGWDNEFLPLDLHDVTELENMLKIDRNVLDQQIMYLYDRDWISYGDSRSLIFPYSFFHLFCFEYQKTTPLTESSDIITEVKKSLTSALYKLPEIVLRERIRSLWIKSPK